MAYRFGYFGIICISEYSHGASLVPMGETPGFSHRFRTTPGLVVVASDDPGRAVCNAKEIDMDKRFRRRKHRR